MSQKSLVIGVIGTGTMGCGIAQVAAQCGYQVLFQNRKQDSVDRAIEYYEKLLYLYPDGENVDKAKKRIAELGQSRDTARSDE